MRNFLLALSLIVLPLSSAFAVSPGTQNYTPTGTTPTTGQVPMYQDTAIPESQIPSSIADVGGIVTIGNPVGKVSALPRVVDSSHQSDTLAATDCAHVVTYASTTAVTVTVPTGLPAGCSVSLVALGTGGSAGK